MFTSAEFAPRRVAMVSMHTSPLDSAGAGDAGGMNVYVAKTAAQLARAGVAGDVFTRARSVQELGATHLSPGVLVHGITAGPLGQVPKDDLPGLVVPFTRETLSYAEAMGGPGFDLLHGHYWLSGLVGTICAQRWQVPHVLTMHTAAKVKNRQMVGLVPPEPDMRVLAEQDLVKRVDALIANTSAESQDLVREYKADSNRISVVTPGVDLRVYQPGSKLRARARVGLATDADVLLYVGRIQRLKAPDHLLRVAARMMQLRPELRRTLRIVICGGQSGAGDINAESLTQLAVDLGVWAHVSIEAATGPDRLADWYRAADVTVVPSYTETFGLVALESLACGTPVVASDVGGLQTAVGANNGGLLIPNRDVDVWAEVIGSLVTDHVRQVRMSRAGAEHARGFDWAYTAWNTLAVYRDAIARSGRSSAYATSIIDGVTEGE
jgi:D-inositol-3-phosphate glycosyltransferase